MAIDTSGREVVIQGPRGKIKLVPVLDEQVLKQLKVGDPAVITYAEALVIKLEKATD